jgi:hypothetical protein
VPLTFQDKASKYELFEGFCFWAEDGDKPVRCWVPYRVITDRYKTSSPKAARAAFEAHRSEIENAAALKYNQGQLERDGSVLIDRL